MSHVRTDQSDVRQRDAHAGTVTQISSDVIKYRLSHRHESLTATLHCNDHILAHIHFCIYTLHTHTHTHTHNSGATHICTRLLTEMHTWVRACARTFITVFVCLCVCVCVRVHMCESECECVCVCECVCDCECECV